MKRMKGRFAVLPAVALCAAAVFSKSPQRLDIYDNADNHLMFVMFEYENEKNVSRTVYMSDSTFVRKVLIIYDLQGNRASEISINFNNDTSFVSDYQYRGDTASFSIKDYFGIDQMGGRVRYKTNDDLHFSFSYQDPFKPGSSVIYTIDYEKNNDNDFTKVSVSDNIHGLSHYGLFSYGGTRTAVSFSTKAPQAVVHVRSAKAIEMLLNLEKAAQVRCGLLSLSGRRIGTLFDNHLAAGRHFKSLRVGQGLAPNLAEGVYLFFVAIDGKVAAKGRFLFQRSNGGAQ